MKPKPKNKRGRPKKTKQPEPETPDWQNDLLPDFTKIKPNARVWVHKLI